jgi:hypothetical protein
VPCSYDLSTSDPPSYLEGSQRSAESLIQALHDVVTLRTTLLNGGGGGGGGGGAKAGRARRHGGHGAGARHSYAATHTAWVPAMRTLVAALRTVGSHGHPVLDAALAAGEIGRGEAATILVTAPPGNIHHSAYMEYITVRGWCMY